MIRKAVLDDVPHIHALLQAYQSREGLMASPLGRLYDHIRDFWVFENPDTGEVIGCCALMFRWKELAEIRSLAVDQAHTGQGIGSALTERAIQEAFYFKIKEIFTRTCHLDFFKNFGFSQIDRESLRNRFEGIDPVPDPDADETVMLKSL